MPLDYQKLVEEVTDPGCKTEALDLANQKITDGWIRRFLNVLKDDNHSVKRIDLRNNYITNTGAFYISYILRADLNPAEMDLTELNLEDNYITDVSLLRDIESALTRNQQLATTAISVTTSSPPTPTSSAPATPPVSITDIPPSTALMFDRNQPASTSAPPAVLSTHSLSRSTPPASSSVSPAVPSTHSLSRSTQIASSSAPPAVPSTRSLSRSTPAASSSASPAVPSTHSLSRSTPPASSSAPPTDIISRLAVTSPPSTLSYTTRRLFLQNATTGAPITQQTSLTVKGGAALTTASPLRSSTSSGEAGLSTLMMGVIIGASVVIIAVIIWATKVYRRRPSRAVAHPQERHNTHPRARLGISAFMPRSTPHAFPNTVDKENRFQPYDVFGSEHSLTAPYALPDMVEEDYSAAHPYTGLGAVVPIKPAATVNDYVYNEAMLGTTAEVENYYSVPGEDGAIYEVVAAASSASYEQPIPLGLQERYYDRAVETGVQQGGTDSDGYERPVPVSLQNREAGTVFHFEHQPALYAVASNDIVEDAEAISPFYNEVANQPDFVEALYDEASNEASIRSPMSRV